MIKSNDPIRHATRHYIRHAMRHAFAQSMAAVYTGCRMGPTFRRKPFRELNRAIRITLAADLLTQGTTKSIHLRKSTIYGGMRVILRNAEADALEGCDQCDELIIIDSPALVVPPRFIIRDMISICQNGVKVEICIEDPIVVYLGSISVPEVVLAEMPGMRFCDVIEISALEGHEICGRCILEAFSEEGFITIKLQCAI